MLHRLNSAVYVDIVTPGTAFVRGLTAAKIGSMVEFEHGAKGVVMNIQNRGADVAVITTASCPPVVGEGVISRGEIASFPVGAGVFGELKCG